MPRRCLRCSHARERNKTSPSSSSPSLMFSRIGDARRLTENCIPRRWNSSWNSRRARARLIPACSMNSRGARNSSASGITRSANFPGLYEYYTCARVCVFVCVRGERACVFTRNNPHTISMSRSFLRSPSCLRGTVRVSSSLNARKGLGSAWQRVEACVFGDICEGYPKDSLWNLRLLFSLE